MPSAKEHTEFTYDALPSRKDEGVTTVKQAGKVCGRLSCGIEIYILSLIDSA